MELIKGRAFPFGDNIDTDQIFPGRYLELTEGYIIKTALDKDNQVIGYQFVRLGKMMEAIRHGTDPKEAYEKNIGTYGRFSAEQGAVKYIDPREE